MIFYISTDPHERLMIWLITGVTLIVLGIYAFFWTKYKMKMPVFKAVPIEKLWLWTTKCTISSAKAWHMVNTDFPL